MKIGIFGGTFDPIHLGHLIVAQRILDEMKLDRILFVPATINPFKVNKEVTRFKTRLDMVCKDIHDNDRFFVTGIDTGEEISYTYDTVEILKARHPNDELFFICGADNLIELHRWKNFEKLSQMIEFICVNRNDFDHNILKEQVEKLKRDFETKIHFVDCPNIEISSSSIRERVRSGKSIKYLVSPIVEKFIERHHLYTNKNDEDNPDIIEMPKLEHE